MAKLQCPNCSVYIRSLDKEAGTAQCHDCKSTFEIEQLFLTRYSNEHKQISARYDGIEHYDFGDAHHIELQWRKLSNWKFRLVLGGIGTPIATFICLTALGRGELAAFLILGLFVLIFGHFLMEGIQLLMNVTTIRLHHGYLHMNHSFRSPFSNFFLTLDACEIDQIYVVQNDGGKVNDRQIYEYTVHAKTSDGKDLALVKNLKESDMALFLEVVLEEELGIKDYNVSGEYNPDRPIKNFDAQARKEAATLLREIRGLPAKQTQMLCPKCHGELNPEGNSFSSKVRVCETCQEVFEVDEASSIKKSDELGGEDMPPDEVTVAYQRGEYHLSLQHGNAGSKVGSGIITALAGLFGLFFLLSFSLAPLIMMIFAAISLIPISNKLLTESKFEVAGDTLICSSSHRLYGEKKRRQFSKQEIDQLFVKSRLVETEDHSYRRYDLFLIAKNGDRHILVEGFRQAKPLLYVEQELELRLRIVDRRVEGEFDPNIDLGGLSPTEIFQLLGASIRKIRKNRNGE